METRDSADHMNADSAQSGSGMHGAEHDAAPVPLERTTSIDEEPKQPANIPNALDHALQSIDRNNTAYTNSSTVTNNNANTNLAPTFNKETLTSNDVKYLFSGAPHFILEKGRYNHWYPHALFPWNTGVQSIQDLWDREPLRHESFTLSTLHAHLPVPNLKKDHSESQDLKEETDHCGAKRSTFDLGIFEVPNMLSMNGKEPGAIGFRHFLEFATADAVRYYPVAPKAGDDFIAGGCSRETLKKLPLTQAFETLEHMHDPYSECDNPDVILNRHKLLCEGPAAWKRIGVREVHTKDIVERLAVLSDFRMEALQKNKQITILDKESTEVLHNRLYSTLLYPPPKKWNHYNHGNLKGQIEVLTKVLAVKGAWIDFSLPEARLRLGQILWETSPHADGDCLDLLPDNPTSPEVKKINSLIHNGLERKWLLLQLLLAAELLVRLDAVVRLAILQPSKDVHVSVTSQDVHELDKLKNGKVNWDVLLVQRFTDNLAVRYSPPRESPPDSPTEKGKAQVRQTLLSRLGSLSKHQQQQHSPPTAKERDCAWDCILSPRHPERQLQGLSVFAKCIDWPEHESILKKIRSNLRTYSTSERTTTKIRSNLGTYSTSELTTTSSGYYSTPVRNPQPKRLFGKKDTYTRNPSHQYIVLHTPSNQHPDPDHCAPNEPGTLRGEDIGGWLSRSWLTGLILPGDSINHLLICTILENDPNALRTLGPVANLYGGFRYMGSMWWSTKCVVGRVLAALGESRTCMGWVKLPRQMGLVDEKTGNELDNTWFAVSVEDMPKNTRIRQGTKLAIESHPLGQEGEVSGDTFRIPVDDPDDAHNHNHDHDHGSGFSVKINNLVFSTQEEKSVKGVVAVNQASVSFHLETATLSTTEPPLVSSLSFPLAYNVHFISSYTCRPPRGSITHRQQFTITSSNNNNPSPKNQHYDDHDHDHTHSHDSKHQSHSHLPGHPLHSSYSYKHIPLSSLRADTAYKKKPEPGQEANSVWILDARASHEHEVFARAWCAATGTNALVGRVGRTCLACCVREARAVDVGVVIRVGARQIQS